MPCMASKTTTRALADLHDQFSSTIDSSIITDLARTKHSVKSHAEAISSDAGKLADTVDHERKTSTHALGDHGKAVGMVGQAHPAPVALHDPHITHEITERQLKKQLEVENSLTKSTIHYQGISESNEERVSRL